MNESTTSIKKCLSCNRPVKGRADKKFCDDFCRNNYNNLLKGDVNNVVRNINNGLRKNRLILANLLIKGEETIKVHRDKMTASGFQFKYHTHQVQNKKGGIYFFCYEYGYMALESDWYLVVKGK